MYFNAVCIAFIYLLSFGYWVAYFIPASIMHIVAVYWQKRLTSWLFVFYSILVSTLMGISLDFLVGDAVKQGWWKWPTNWTWATAPEFGIIGLVYGSLYWHWYVKPFQQASAS